MRSIWRTLDRDTRTGIAAVLLAVAMIGISYGATAVASGFPLWMPIALGVVVLAGGAEFLFLGIIAAGGNPFAAVLAGLVLNARHLPYGLSLPEVTGTGWRRLLGTHVMNDESVAVALAQPDGERRRAAYWACGVGVMVVWPGGAAVGAVVGSLVPDTSAFGLDAVFPAVLAALVVPALRDRHTFGAVAAGVAVALATAPFLPPGMPVLCALSGVLVAALTLRRADRRDATERGSVAATRPATVDTAAAASFASVSVARGDPGTAQPDCASAARPVPGNTAGRHSVSTAAPDSAGAARPTRDNMARSAVTEAVEPVSDSTAGPRPVDAVGPGSAGVARPAEVNAASSAVTTAELASVSTARPESAGTGGSRSTSTARPGSTSPASAVPAGPARYAPVRSGPLAGVNRLEGSAGYVRASGGKK